MTLEATDTSDLTVGQEFSITVNPHPNRAPIALGTTSVQQLDVDGVPRVVDMSDFFHDLDADTLDYTVSSDNTGVVSVKRSGSHVTLVPEGNGSAMVAITADDGEFTATYIFTVSVGDVDVPMLKLSGRIPTQELTVGEPPVTLYLKSHFVGPVDRYTASSDNPSVVSIHMVVGGLDLKAVGEGRATVTVEAVRGDLVAKQTFTVLVAGARVTDPGAPDLSLAVLIPDENLRARVRHVLGLGAGDTITQQKMQHLTQFNASTSDIENITGLEHATRLRQLWIDSNAISDLTPLKNLTSLTDLTAHSNQISDLTPLKNLTSLIFLSLSWNKISDLTPLANLTNLTLLRLRKNPISDLTPLANLTNLTELGLAENPISDLTPLANLTNLTELWMNNNQISDLTPLANLTNLARLFLHNNGNESHDNQISDLTPLKNLTNLKRLVIYGNEIRDITSLANLTNLTELSLMGNQISDLTPLKNLTSLKSLSLPNNQINDISPLANLTALTHLGLHGNQISDVTVLERLTSLKTLWLRQNPITDLAPLRRLKDKNPNVNIDVDINADVDNVQAAPSSRMLPAETALLSNYPNPFNPETWIPYQLAKAADVTLTIYDVRGVVVRQLVLGHQSAGFYQNRTRAAHWDGRNGFGEKVTSGLYFFTFTADDFTATRRMLILK